ncbi:MAG: polysaccharide deacetylase family protein [Jatrophihabitans sp.]|uniref:polysaccharide deacetylase family protein n=1 Tax=Jatrophihabitans sp. TaxID=1932789 RepID=UPI00391447FF
MCIGSMATMKDRARSRARSAALDALSLTAERSGRTERGLARPRVLFLLFHEVRPGEEDAFRTLVRQMQRGHRLVSHSEAVSRVLEDRIDGCYASISFDDGFTSGLVAARILEEEGATACFFVCPDLLDKDRAELVRTFPLIDRAERGSLTWDELEDLRARGHEINSHTLTHPIIAGVPAEEAARQIIASREQLASRLDSGAHFAWPHGQFADFTPAARAAVEQAGYVSGASAVRGAHTSAVAAGTVPCLRRENIDLAWPARHVQYFLGRSALRSTPADNLWPASLSPAGEAA